MASKAKKRLHYMPFFIGDYYRSTIGWSNDADHSHRLLLDAQWEFVVLPRDIEELAHICRRPVKQFKPIWEKYLKAKFPVVKGGRQNARLEVHREESIRASNHGKIAADARHAAERAAKEETAKAQLESTVTELAQRKRLDKGRS